MKIFVITCVILALCDAYAVVEKSKCSLSDSDCQAKLYKGIIEDYTDKGDADLGIPSLDPYVIKDFDVTLLGMIKVTAVEGKVIGFKSCHANSFKTEAGSMRTQIDLTCDTFHVEGQYKASTLPTFDALLGGLNIHGDGEAKLDFEKVNVMLDFAFEIVKLDDGEYHIQINKEDSKHTMDIAGKASIDITNVFVGSQDISTVASAIINENWKIAVKLLGQTLLDSVMEIFYVEAAKFFNGFPAKNLLSDDLSKYVKS